MASRYSFRAFAVFFCLAVGSLTACSGGADTATYSINGYITDVFTGAPLAGARVTFASDTLYRAEATSDSDGLFEMTVTTDTEFGEVRAELAGYQPVETTVFFDMPERRIDLRMRPGTDDDAGM
jgi:hypothetical protein